MYKTNRQLRQDAQQALAGKWGTAVLLFILNGLLTLVVSSIPLIGYAGSLLTIILNVGFLSFLLKLCCGQKTSASLTDLFYGFQCHPGKALLLYLLTILYMLPGSILYAVLAAVFLFVSFSGMDMDISYINPAAIIGMVLVLLVLTLLFMVYAIYIDLTYGMVYFILLDYPELPVNEIWRRSKQLMKGHRKQYLFLQLSFVLPQLLPAVLLAFSMLVISYSSFLGIILLTASSVLFCGITVWLNIYSSAASAAMYLNLIQNYGRNTL